MKGGKGGLKEKVEEMMKKIRMEIKVQEIKKK